MRRLLANRKSSASSRSEIACRPSFGGLLNLWPKLEDALSRSERRRTAHRRGVKSIGKRVGLAIESLESRRVFSAGALTGDAVIVQVDPVSNQPIAQVGQAAVGAMRVPGMPAAPGALAELAQNGGQLITPREIRHAYGIDQVGWNGAALDGSGQTIAIIDAFDAPTIGYDLSAFDATFGLAPPPQFQKFWYTDQFGRPPAPNAEWATETSLDVEWAHAMAPGANIMLVEANTDDPANFFHAASWARQQPGVSVVSMSYGLPEFAGENYYDSVFTTPAGHQGVTFVCASGDRDSGHGYLPNDPTGRYPAASPNVVAVGATMLSTDGGGDYLGEIVRPDQRRRL